MMNFVIITVLLLGLSVVKCALSPGTPFCEENEACVSGWCKYTTSNNFDALEKTECVADASGLTANACTVSECVLRATTTGTPRLAANVKELAGAMKSGDKFCTKATKAKGVGLKKYQECATGFCHYIKEGDEYTLSKIDWGCSKEINKKRLGYKSCYLVAGTHTTGPEPAEVADCDGITEAASAITTGFYCELEGTKAWPCDSKFCLATKKIKKMGIRCNISWMCACKHNCIIMCG